VWLRSFALHAKPRCWVQVKAMLYSLGAKQPFLGWQVCKFGLDAVSGFAPAIPLFGFFPSFYGFGPCMKCMNVIYVVLTVVTVLLQPMSSYVLLAENASVKLVSVFSNSVAYIRFQSVGRL